MAGIKIPIVIDGLDFVLEVLKGIIENADLTEESEEYKNGFYDFANALNTTIGKMIEKREWRIDNGKSK